MTKMNQALVRSPAAIALACLLVWLPIAARGADIYWNNPATTGAGRNFNSGPNWDTMMVPGTADSASIANGGDVQITGNQNPRTLTVGSKSTGGVFTSGTGSATHTAGGLGSDGTSTQWLDVGVASGSQGTYSLSGTGSVRVNNDVQVGREGTGTFTQSGNLTRVDAGWIDLGKNPGGDGTYNFNNGFINLRNDLELGSAGGTGKFNMNAGVLNVNWVTLGRESATGVGQITMTGGTMNLRSTHLVNNAADDPGSDNALSVGLNGTGTFTQSGGKVNTIVLGDIGWINVGKNAGSHGTYNLSQTGELIAAHVVIAEDGNGQFNQSGGALTVTEGLNVGRRAGSAGIYQMTAGTAEAGCLWVGEWGTGQYVQTGGTLSVGTEAFVGIRSGGRGTFTLNGGTQTIGDILRIGRDAGSNGTYNLQAGLLDMTGGTITLGAGTAAFNMTGGELRNAGVIDFNFIQHGGILEPGGSAGQTAVNRNYTLESHGELQIEINGLTPISEFDRLVVRQGVSLAGSLDVILGFAPQPGNTFLILDNAGTGAIQGTFAGLAENAILFESFNSHIYPLRISYHGGTGNDVVLTTLVPEPGTFTLAALGVVLLGIRLTRCMSVLGRTRARGMGGASERI